MTEAKEPTVLDFNMRGVVVLTFFDENQQKVGPQTEHSLAIRFDEVFKHTKLRELWPNGVQVEIMPYDGNHLTMMYAYGQLGRGVQITVRFDVAKRLLAYGLGTTDCRPEGIVTWYDSVDEVSEDDS